MTIDLASERDAGAWDDFVARRPDATGYHLWGWRGIFSRAFGHSPLYLIARSGEQIAGVLPLVLIRGLVFGRSLTSLPFLNYGGIVAQSASVADELAAASAVLAQARRCDYVELRHVARRFESFPCKQHKVAMMLPLAGVSWERLDRKVRNQIRKAQKSELGAENGGGELVGDFYRVFARNMRDLGTPVYGRRLFDEVLATFPAQARVHVVRLGDLPVAAGITYETRTTVEVPWASSIRDYNSLCPNSLLYWSIIERALETGATVLDFGRSTPNEGTYRFKEQWGAQPVPLHWEYPWLKGETVPDVRPTNPRYQLAVRIWKKLPLSVATRVGPSIVRTIP